VAAVLREGASETGREAWLARLSAKGTIRSRKGVHDAELALHKQAVLHVLAP
jgi:hypothetical protein